MAEQTILTALQQRQGAAHLTDEQMAAKLGMSRTMWRRLVSGERRISLRVLQGVVAAYPDLTPQVIAVLLPRD